MRITILKAKIHQACVTNAHIDYDGSCAIDENLLNTVGINEYERIEIYNISNGERFTTYAIRAEKNSNTISINGAAARKAVVGDSIIICAYAEIEAQEVKDFKPICAYLDSKNNILRTRNAIPVQMAG